MTETATTSHKWTEDRVAELTEIVGSETPVPANTVISAATILEVSVRSVASKLRKMGYEVVSLAKARSATFTEDEGNAIAAFVEANPGAFTYQEIAENVFPDGGFSGKQVQGKILSLELMHLVKATEQIAAVKQYSEEEDAIFIKMANEDAFIEDIAAKLGREVPSIRGKALSLSQKGLISKIPTQKNSVAKNTTDPYDDLGDAISTMTVEDIATAVDKTVRGVKTVLTRRGIKVANYDGAAKHAKALAKAETKD